MDLEKIDKRLAAIALIVIALLLMGYHALYAGKGNGFTGASTTSTASSTTIFTTSTTSSTTSSTTASTSRTSTTSSTDASTSSTTIFTTTTEQNAQVVYSHYSFAHFCPDNMTCWRKISIFASGIYLMEGDRNKTMQLNQSALNSLYGAIRATGILGKNCTGFIPQVHDAGSTYGLNLDGKKNVVDGYSNSCPDELNAITSVVSSITGEEA